MVGMKVPSLGVPINCRESGDDPDMSVEKTAGNQPMRSTPDFAEDSFTLLDDASGLLVSSLNFPNLQVNN